MRAVFLDRVIRRSGIVALALFVCLTPRLARASAAQIDLSKITFNGTGSCSSSPCESFNISFQWNAATQQVSSMSIQSSGAFGAFAFDGDFASSLGTSFVWTDKQGVTLTLLDPCSLGQSSCTLNLSDISLACATSACAQDFGLSWDKLFLHPSSGSVSDPKSTPEPSLLLQLLLGLLLLAAYPCWPYLKASLRSRHFARL